jgi:CBS domain-containing protein
MTLADLVDNVMLRQRVSFIPVMERGVLLGHMDSAVLNGIDRENWSNTHVGDVYVALSDDTIIPSNMPVTELFERIAASGQRKFLVVDERRLAGVITTADLTRYLALVQELGRRAGYAEPPRSRR